MLPHLLNIFHRISLFKYCCFYILKLLTICHRCNFTANGDLLYFYNAINYLQFFARKTRVNRDRYIPLCENIHI